MAWAGWLIVVLLVLFSLAGGLCSVAAKDVIGKSVPKTRRGRLNGLSATLAGLLLTGSIGAMSSVMPPEGVILVLTVAGLVGAALVQRLPEAA